MAAFVAKKAKRTRRPLKVSMEGVSGSGKTLTCLLMAHDMIRNGIGKKIVVIDSENESAGLYAGMTMHGMTLEYDTIDMPADKRNPAGYTEAYEWAVANGDDIVIIDSLSHAWDGALEIVDQIGSANRGDKMKGWATLSPQQRTMIQTLTDPRAHTFVTMRVKSDFQDQEVNGRTRKVKVGLKADQRDNTEYEFDLVLRCEAGNEVHVDKVRGCSDMNGKSAVRPGPAFWKPLFDWWKSADDVVPTATVQAATDNYDAVLADIKASDTDEKLAAAKAAVRSYTGPADSKAKLTTAVVYQDITLAADGKSLDRIANAIEAVASGGHVTDKQAEWLRQQHSKRTAELNIPT